MKNINRIIETFKGEKEIIIICSKELALKLNQDMANFNTKTDGQQGLFKDQNKIDLGFNSIFKNGVTLHYTSDFIADVMRCFSMKEDEIKDSIKYDIKYFGGNNVSKLTERLNAIEDLRDLVNRFVFK